MAIKRRWTIQSLFLLLVTGPLLLLALGYAFFAHQSATPSPNTYFHSAVLIANQITPAIENLLVHSQSSDFNKSLKGFTEDPRIAEVTLLSPQNEVLFSYQRTGALSAYIHQHNILKPEGRAATPSESPSFKNGVQLEESDFILGKLKIGLTDQSQSGATFFSRSLLLIIGIFFLYGWLVGRRIERNLSISIDHIERYAAQPEKELPFKPVETGVAELEKFQKAFARISAELAEKNALVQLHSQHQNETKHSLLEKLATQGLFLERITHELRTPLNGVYGMMQLLQDSPEPSLETEYVNIARSSTEKLMAVTDQIRDFINLENGALSIEPRHVSIPDMVKSIYLLFTGEAFERGLKYSMVVNGDNEPILAYADDSRIKQILYDLIKNAIAHTEQGEIQVNLNLSMSKYLQLIVNIDDSGTTIPESQFKHVLDPVKSFSLKGDNRFGPFILRLININKLVALLGGSFSVSPSPLGGIRFSLKLAFPYRSMTNPPAPNPSSAPPPRAKILLVEDNAVSQKVAQALLAKLNMACDIACNGKQAVNLHQTDMYDLIFMDCQMPIMDGYEATRKIRQHEQEHRNPRTPIIALTAEALPGVEERCLEAGMDAYITKPVTKEQLIRMIERFTVTETPSHTH